jgi:hypothetical protein
LADDAVAVGWSFVEYGEYVEAAEVADEFIHAFGVCSVCHFVFFLVLAGLLV